MTGKDTHPSDHRLVDYAARLLSPETAEALREHLRGCERCAERFRIVVRDREMMRTTERPRVVDGRLVMPDQGRKRRLLPRRRAFTGFAVAAGILVVIVTSKMMQSEPGLYWMPFEPTEVVLLRDAASEVAATYEKAMAAYANHDAAETVRLLQSIELDPRRRDAAAVMKRVLEASALLNTGASEAALQALPVSINFLPAPWRGRAGWIHYLALRESGQIDASCERLLWLERESGDIKALVDAERASVSCTQAD